MNAPFPMVPAIWRNPTIFPASSAKHSILIQFHQKMVSNVCKFADKITKFTKNQ